ncbi:MAG: hypothetical protein HYT09_01770 [Candidatus Levybacteria bacterium]|nr:hypothetical protein [Candidatus Levybacteria bacterium]
MAGPEISGQLTINPLIERPPVQMNHNPLVYLIEGEIEIYKSLVYEEVAASLGIPFQRIAIAGETNPHPIDPGDRVKMGFQYIHVGGEDTNWAEFWEGVNAILTG